MGYTHNNNAVSGPDFEHHKSIPVATANDHDLYISQNRDGDGQDTNTAQGYGGLGVGGLRGFFLGRGVRDGVR